jgi:hypothetical protein
VFVSHETQPSWSNLFLHTHIKFGGFFFPNDKDSAKKISKMEIYIRWSIWNNSLIGLSIWGKGLADDDADFDYAFVDF